MRETGPILPQLVLVSSERRNCSYFCCVAELYPCLASLLFLGHELYLEDPRVCVHCVVHSPLVVRWVVLSSASVCIVSGGSRTLGRHAAARQNRFRCVAETAGIRFSLVHRVESSRSAPVQGLHPRSVLGDCVEGISWKYLTLSKLASTCTELSGVKSILAQQCCAGWFKNLRLGTFRFSSLRLRTFSPARWRRTPRASFLQPLWISGVPVLPGRICWRRPALRV